MSIFKCKMCGGTLEINENQTTAVCEYCGTIQTLPKLDDDRRVQMYDRANHFRRNNEFDKAMGIYEQILNEDNTDAEAYWSIVLCRYGIEYVEDPATHKRVPTVNRAQFTSIFDDEDYKSALRYADGYQRSIYEEEAHTINEIQKGILAISQKEEPFDVFICYKETDNNGRRTQDSVLANDLYHQLTQEGFKVFFSRITLEDKLGTAYEPYIFAALNSAKVMVVIGTKPEYFNAVWVKNEWSRYLTLIKNGAKKILIPAYRDMDPYDLPEEFSHLQAQDMSKLGFMQDLIRGIKKLTETDTPKTPVQETVVVSGKNSDTGSLLKRAFMYLEDGAWQNADSYCERVLDIDPENAEAYLGKMMAEMQIRRLEELKNTSPIIPENSKGYQEALRRGPEAFESNGNYQKAFRFADDKLKSELKDIAREFKYRFASGKMLLAKTGYDYMAIAGVFHEISGYKDSEKLEAECSMKAEEAQKDPIFTEAGKLAERVTIDALEQAIELYKSIPGWKNADELAISCGQRLEELKIEQQRKAEQNRIAAEKWKRKAKKIAIIGTPIIVVVVAFLIVLNSVIIPNGKYNDAITLMNEGKYEEAIAAFTDLGDYSDAKEQIVNCNNLIHQGYYDEALNLLKNGQIYDAVVKYLNSECYQYNDDIVNAWMTLYANTIAAGRGHTVAITDNGTALATEYTGDYYKGECDVSNWKNIVSIAAGWQHTVGLKPDGTVVAVGNNDDKQCNVNNWDDIVSIATGWNHTVGLKSDGTVIAVGNNYSGQCDVSDWHDIVMISAGGNGTVGLKADGTVVFTGDEHRGDVDVSDWSDIAFVATGEADTLGIKKNGTVVYCSNPVLGIGSVWENLSGVTKISVGDGHAVALTSDGALTAVLYSYHDDYGQCDVSDWPKVIDVSAGGHSTVALLSNGAAISTDLVGHSILDDGQTAVQEWTNIRTPEQ